MNKLEMAIRKNSGDRFYGSSLFGERKSTHIEEISKMETSFLLTEEELKSKKIIHPNMKDKKAINSFRELRSSILEKEAGNVVMVTAIGAKSGTSYFARNLAASIAFDTSKTALLMDCNNNNNDTSEIFDLQHASGVTEFVANSNKKIEDIIFESGLKRLRIVPFGNDQLNEQYSHPRFEQLLTELKSTYQDRHIVIDSPAILNSADTRILLNLCDQVIVVVPYGKVSRSSLEQAIALIGRDKFSGVVFNDYLF